MTQRERTFGIVIGLAVTAIASLYAVSLANSASEARDDELVKLDQEKQRKDRTVKEGERAIRQLQEFQKQSLPGDPTLAGSLYSQWLLKEAVAVGIASPNVSLMPARPRGDVYVQHAFLIDGQANLQQVTQFLYQFYSVGYLHRIGRLNLKPLAGKNQLDVNITVEALSLKGAPNPKELTPPPSNRLAGTTVESYLTDIAGRNLFAPANNPPRIDVARSQRGNPSRSVSFTAKASDADSLDKLTWALEGPAPEGARMDPRSGEFRWTPNQVGEYEVAIRVTDDGMPAKSAIEKVKISVVDAPPPVAETPKPKKLDFDPAQHAFITAIVQTNGKWQIWVNSRTEGKILRFEEGDKISLGSINAVVKAIRPDEAELSLDGAQSVTVRMGKSLAAVEPSATGA